MKQLIEAIHAMGAKVLFLYFAVWGKSRWQPYLDMLGKPREWWCPCRIWISIEMDTDTVYTANFVGWFDFSQVGICCDTGSTYGELGPLTMEGNTYTCFSMETDKLKYLHVSDVAYYFLPQGRGKAVRHSLLSRRRDRT